MMISYDIPMQSWIITLLVAEKKQMIYFVHNSLFSDKEMFVVLLWIQPRQKFWLSII